MRVTFILLSALLFGASMGLSTFQITADAKIELTNGHYNGTLYYKYDGSGTEKHYLRIEYTYPINMYELIDYHEGVKYKVCTSCETGFYQLSVPIFAKQIGDVASGESEGSCKRYVPADTSGLNAIWYDNSATICKVELTDGRTISLRNVKNTPIDTSKFTASNSCPNPICKRVMDLVFVVDISGSVGSYNWNNKIKPFMKDLVNSFDIGEDATQVGILTYGTTARKVLGLSDNKNTIINAITSATYTGGNTCTGCGINMGMSFLNDTATHRTDRNPEKIMIVMTDGQNQQAQGTPCADYEAKCTKRGTTCKKRKCSGTWVTTKTSVCEEYGPSKKCKRFQCSDCKGDWGTTCLNRTCSTYNTSSCSVYDPSYCTSTWPTGCTIKSGVITSPYKNGAKCLCAVYKCLEYECTSYKCNEYTCDDCKTRSSVCAEYEQVCIKNATIETCDGSETCEEYECLEGKAVCNKTYSSTTAMLNGAVTLTRTEWALYPASKRLPIVIAIGVGSIRLNELKAIASTLEGKTLMYLVSDFSALSSLFDDLIEETCIKQTENLEPCDLGCKGFCGCNKKCYCPTCEAPTGYCYNYTCETNNIVTDGCLVEYTDCSVPNKCKVPEPRNDTKGCCTYMDKTCSTSDQCLVAYCDETSGCKTKERECTSDDPCRNVTGCDPSSGCQYGDACPDLGLCKIKTCTAYGSTFKCSYADKCTSNDPCMIPICDEATGDCSEVPMNCTPKNPCNIGKCYNGQCYEETNITLKIECANAAPSTCVEGFCNESTGQCSFKRLDEEDNTCLNCDLNDTVDCTALNNGCYVYTCEGLTPTSDSPYPVKCVPTPTKTVENKCLNMTCVNDEWVENGYDCQAPKDDCHFVSCVYNSTSDEAKCVETTNLDKTVDGVCVKAICNESGLPDYEYACEEHKNCYTYVGCTIGTDGQAKCHYEPIDCTKEDNMCTTSFCNETTGQCVHLSNATNCNPHNPCKTYDCFNYSGCQIYDVSCDDKNNCTDDECVPLSAYDPSDYANITGFTADIHDTGSEEDSYVCVRTPKCVAPSYCTRASCYKGKCTIYNYNCDEENENSTLDSCRTYKCDEESRKCKATLLPAAFLDVCGSCMRAYADDSSYNEDLEAKKCIAGMTMPNFAATIGGAAIAGIVIVAVVVAAAIAISSAIGTKELIKRAKKNADVGTNTNPLYEAEDNEASNPTFTGEN